MGKTTLACTFWHLQDVDIGNHDPAENCRRFAENLQSSILTSQTKSEKYP